SLVPEVVRDGVMRLEPSVDEAEVRRVEVEPRAPEEVVVRVGHVDAVGAGVVLERGEAAVDAPEIEVAALEVVEHHLVVVAAQEGAARAGAGLGGALQLQQPVDRPLRVRPPVRVVADENEAVVGAGREQLEEHVEGAGAAVDVSDGDEAHAGAAPHSDPMREPPPGLKPTRPRPDFLMRPSSWSVLSTASSTPLMNVPLRSVL